MKIDELDTYEEIIAYLDKKKRPKHLLLGNGFSMAFDSKIFSYNVLSEFIKDSDNPKVAELFKRLNTKNFELIMQQLDNFCEIADLFSNDKNLVSRIKTVTEQLKKSLIDAIKKLHPKHVFKIPDEKSKSCMSFLQEHLTSDGFIFSTNYDLLLYWVLMRNRTKDVADEKIVDGFGRDKEIDQDSDEYKSSEDSNYSELRWGKNKGKMTIFHLHGTLLIFDTGVNIVKEVYDNMHYLLENIEKRIDNKEYPIFVTAGNGEEKLEHIMHNKYLIHCYDQLCSIEGSLVTFGFNFGEYDDHIINAINKAAKMGMKTKNKLLSIYIGVYSDEDLEYIEGIKGKFKCKVNLYNARTAKIWDNKGSELV